MYDLRVICVNHGIVIGERNLTHIRKFILQLFEIGLLIHLPCHVPVARRREGFPMPATAELDHITYICLYPAAAWCFVFQYRREVYNCRLYRTRKTVSDLNSKNAIFSRRYWVATYLTWIKFLLKSDPLSYYSTGLYLHFKGIKSKTIDVSRQLRNMTNILEKLTIFKTAEEYEKYLKKTDNF
jgi:hypothetical protein